MSALPTQRLRLFIDKVERLQASALLRTLLEQGVGLNLTWSAETKELRLSCTAPVPDETEAAILTLRFFLQPRDGISLGQIAQLYEELPLSAELKDSYQLHYSRLQQLLKSPACIQINGDCPTRWEILETILYGDMVHANPDKRQRYLAWVAHPFAASIVGLELHNVLQFYLRTLAAMADIHRRALAELGGEPHPPSGDTVA